MRKLDINFDVIDKTYDARGEHNIRRWFRVNKAYDVTGAIVPTTYLALCLTGLESPEEALIKAVSLTGFYFGVWATLDVIVASLKTKLSGMNYKQRAYLDLTILSYLLNEHGINISVDQIMEANIYHKDYKLSREGIPGIIRERYFEVPTTDENGDEIQRSVKEEHLIGSKKYTLSFDKPVEQKQYKLAYNM